MLEPFVVQRPTTVSDSATEEPAAGYARVPPVARAPAPGNPPIAAAPLHEGPREGALDDTATPTSTAIAMPASSARNFDVFGPLAAHMRDERVTDVIINGTRGLWIDRGAGLEREPGWNLAEPALRALAVKLIAAGGRHIDEAAPCVDVRLGHTREGGVRGGVGVRVHAVLPPISTAGTLLSIRLPRARPLSLSDLRRGGMFDGEVESLLREAVSERSNVLVTGAAATGKTTMVGALLACAAPSERIVAIEDVAELAVEHSGFISLEARQANLEGAGGLSVQALLREALRMRPDRIVLGECRGGEVRELLTALNTGHDGGAGTLHANSLQSVPARLEALGALAGMSPEAVARQAVGAIGLVLHLGRVAGIRYLAQAGHFWLGPGDRLRVKVDAAYLPPRGTGPDAPPRGSAGPVRIRATHRFPEGDG
ncbi:CpaF family protein [Homoserinimonas sp. OAct 916]|uniref:CpaF family protein n=1 Tax=Homoserinimonas sp. OAct 916 TaxID=2211450 RepID=UPI0034CDA825